MTIFKTWFSKAFNLSVLQKNRMDWVDYLKGIAIVLVVYRHVLIGIERSGIVIPPALVNANMIFYSFRMPLFFILSGIFINSSLARRTLGRLLYIKFDNLLYPYLIWTFLQVTLQIAFSGYTNASRGFIDYTYILYQPRNLDQFWYLPALFNTTMIYLLIRTKLKVPVWGQLILGVIFNFLASHMWGISMLSDWMEFYLFFAMGDALSALFMKPSTHEFLKKTWLLLVMIPVFTAMQIFYLRKPEIYYTDTLQGKAEFLVIALTGCFSMLVLSFRLQSLGILKFLRVLGFHSLYIYVMHVFAAALLRILLTSVLGIYNPFILLVTCIAFGVTVPVVFYNLFIKDNFLWFLFTTRHKKKETPGTDRLKPEPVTTS